MGSWCSSKRGELIPDTDHDHDRSTSDIRVQNDITPKSVATPSSKSISPIAKIKQYVAPITRKLSNGNVAENKEEENQYLVQLPIPMDGAFHVVTKLDGGKKPLQKHVDHNMHHRSRTDSYGCASPTGIVQLPVPINNYKELIKQQNDHWTTAFKFDDQ